MIATRGQTPDWCALTPVQLPNGPGTAGESTDVSGPVGGTMVNGDLPMVTYAQSGRDFAQERADLFAESTGTPRPIALPMKVFRDYVAGSMGLAIGEIRAIAFGAVAPTLPSPQDVQLIAACHTVLETLADKDRTHIDVHHPQFDALFGLFVAEANIPSIAPEDLGATPPVVDHLNALRNLPEATEPLTRAHAAFGPTPDDPEQPQVVVTALDIKLADLSA